MPSSLVPTVTVALPVVHRNEGSLSNLHIVIIIIIVSLILLLLLLITTLERLSSSVLRQLAAVILIPVLEATSIGLPRQRECFPSSVIQTILLVPHVAFSVSLIIQSISHFFLPFLDLGYFSQDFDPPSLCFMISRVVGD